MEVSVQEDQSRRDAAAGSRRLPRRILVVVDPAAPTQPALEKAERIAQRCGSELELYVCDVTQRLPESWAGGARADDYLELCRQRLLGELAALTRPLRERGFAVEVFCEWHAPLQQDLCHHAIRTRPDLVVKEARRHVSPPHEGFGYHDWNLIRRMPAPLLLVRARPWAAAVRIAAAVAPCPPDVHAVAFDAAIVEDSRMLSRALQGTLDIYQVLRMASQPPAGSAACAQPAGATEVAVRITAGPVTDGLLRLVEQHQPDVLVMGSAARAGADRAATGGTAARVLEGVGCDLLVVKPAGFISPPQAGAG